MTLEILHFSEESKFFFINDNISPVSRRAIVIIETAVVICASQRCPFLVLLLSQPFLNVVHFLLCRIDLKREGLDERLLIFNFISILDNGVLEIAALICKIFILNEGCLLVNEGSFLFLLLLISFLSSSIGNSCRGVLQRLLLRLIQKSACCAGIGLNLSLHRLNILLKFAVNDSYLSKILAHFPERIKVSDLVSLTLQESLSHLLDLSLLVWRIRIVSNSTSVL